MLDKSFGLQVDSLLLQVDFAATCTCFIADMSADYITLGVEAMTIMCFGTALLLQTLRCSIFLNIERCGDVLAHVSASS